MSRRSPRGEPQRMSPDEAAQPSALSEPTGRDPAPTAEPTGDPAEESTTGRALVSTFRTSLVIQAINSVTGIILARSLGVTDRGLLAAALLWPRVLAIVAVMGIEESATYHVARARRSGARVLAAGLTLVTAQSTVFVLVGAVVVPLALSRHGSATVVDGLIFLAFIPIYGLGILFTGLLLGWQRYRWFNRVRLTVALFLLAFQIVLLATGAMGVRSMVIANLAAYGALALYGWVLVRRTEPKRVRPDRQMIRSVFGYGVRSHASTTSSQLNQRLDLLVISIFLSASQLGLYTVAVAFTSLTGLIGASVARVALPTVAGLAAGGQRTLQARRLVSLTLIVSTVLSVPIIILAPVIIDIAFGSAYHAATASTRILIVGAIGFSMSRAIEAVLRAVGRPLDAGIAEFVALGATFVGLAALVPVLGLVGAALASLLAYVVACAWMTRRAARALEVSWLVLFTPDREAWPLMRARLRALPAAVARRARRGR
jgi:O-antigen/teichoic acid export membrane protein